MIRSILAASIRLATGVRLQSELQQLAGPVIYFANHTSHMDFAVVWAALPRAIRERTSPAAAEDYWGATRWRRRIACDLFRAILIPRRDITRHNHPLRRIGESLEAGRSILLFPEGTRAETDETVDFKSGLYHLARRHPEIPLVPVHLENLNRILPRGALLPVPLIARIRFLAPMQLHPGESRSDFLGRARAALEGEAR